MNSGLHAKRKKNFTRLRVRMRVDQRIFIFLFFFIVSGVLWLLNALEAEHEHTLKVGLKFTNIPRNRVLLLDDRQPQYLDVRISAKGFHILQKMVDNKLDTLTVDVSRSLGHSALGTSHLLLATSALRPELERKLGGDLRLLRISPDTLPLWLEKATTKKLPIKPLISFDYQNQYYPKAPPRLFPDSVWLTGPVSLLDSLSFVSTRKIRIQSSEAPYFKSVDLQVPDNSVCSPRKTEIHVAFEKFTENLVYSKISVLNVPDSLTVKTFPSEVKITFLVALANYDLISGQNFQAVADFASLASESDRRLKINIFAQPDEIRNMDYTPKSVEFVIERKP